MSFYPMFKESKPLLELDYVSLCKFCGWQSLYLQLDSSLHYLPHYLPQECKSFFSLKFEQDPRDHLSWHTSGSEVSYPWQFFAHDTFLGLLLPVPLRSLNPCLHGIRSYCLLPSDSCPYSLYFQSAYFWESTCCHFSY